MRGITKSKLGVILSVACSIVLAAALLFGGCAPSGSSVLPDQNTGGTSSIEVDTTVDGGSKLATGGSTTTSGSTTTAVPDAGYELSYWTRTKDSVTAKFATTASVTVGTGESYAPVFVQTSTVTLVSTAAQLQTAMNNNQNIKLTADIVATGSTFSPVTTYSGVLDGAGHRLTISCSSTATLVGGLCSTLTGVIKNLVLDGVVTGTGSSTDQAAGAFAAAINGGLISQCASYVAVTTKSGIAASFVAKATNTTARQSTINSCENYGAILGAKAGAIIFTNGTASSPLTNLVSNKNFGAIQTTSIAS